MAAFTDRPAGTDEQFAVVRAFVTEIVRWVERTGALEAAESFKFYMEQLTGIDELLRTFTAIQFTGEVLPPPARLAVNGEDPTAKWFFDGAYGAARAVANRAAKKFVQDHPVDWGVCGLVRNLHAADAVLREVIVNALYVESLTGLARAYANTNLSGSDERTWGLYGHNAAERILEALEA